jgi:hypothetical protein
MDKLKIKKARSEDKCLKCKRYQKQIARLKKVFIKADDENVRRCMKYEDKIMKFKAEKEWLESEDSSGSQSKKKALEMVGSPNSNAKLRTPSSVKGEENEHCK